MSTYTDLDTDHTGKGSLSYVMDFDHPVRVNADGSVTDDLDGVHAPSLYGEALDSREWELIGGYSGQYNYSGPIMHPSEFIGGALARDILAEPGVYVALVSYCDHSDPDLCPDGDEGCDSADGWAIAYLTGSGDLA